MKLSEYIRKAKGFIGVPDRWVKGKLHYARGSHCALGAMESAEGLFTITSHMPSQITPMMAQAGKIMEEVITGHETWNGRRMDYRGTNAVVTFNDNEATTHDDMMKLFDEAARRAEVKEKEQEESTTSGV